jgi:hypothetical protein
MQAKKDPEEFQLIKTIDSARSFQTDQIAESVGPKDIIEI